MDSSEKHSTSVGLGSASPITVQRGVVLVIRLFLGFLVLVASVSTVSDVKDFDFAHKDQCAMSERESHVRDDVINLYKEVSMKPIFRYAMLAVVVSVVLIAGLVTLTEEAYAIGYCHTICPGYCSNCNQYMPNCVIYPNGPTINCKQWCGCDGPPDPR